MGRVLGSARAKGRIKKKSKQKRKRTLNEWAPERLQQAMQEFDEGKLG